MTRADLLAKAIEHERTALKLHVDGRVQRCLDNHTAADIAWDMRDMFRTMALQALADAEVVT